MRTYYLFLDGIGFGPRADSNPFYSSKKEIFHHLSQDRPWLSKWAWHQDNPGKSWPRFHHTEQNWGVSSIDPSSDVKGLPQSGTGQTSLFTGIDAPLVLDRHIPNFPSFTLKKFIKKYSLFKLMAEAGKKATLLNSYSPYYFADILPREKFISASTLTQMAADLPLMTFHNLVRGESMYMDITCDFLLEAFNSGEKRFLSGDWSGLNQKDLVYRRKPADEGRRFIQIGRDYDLVLFEYFMTDKAGHEQDEKKALGILEVLEEFIEAAVDELGEDETLVISSDHGNLEDLTTRTHTHNAVPLYAFGAENRFFLENVQKLADIPRVILKKLGIPGGFLEEAHTEKL